MTLTLLFAAGEDAFTEYHPLLAEGLSKAGIKATIVTEAPPESVDYILYAPSSPLQDFRPFTRCKAVLSLWAGVERIVSNPTLTQPLARMVDPGLSQGMRDYVTAHVLRHHIGLDACLRVRPGQWQPVEPPLASDRHVGFLGLGVLGESCARALAGLGFNVTGWSRRPRDVPGITCHSGAEGLKTVLQSSEILVTLLPLTPATENLLDATHLAIMREGAVLINPGRGALIDDTALIAALDRGHLSHATLDVFRTEPLPTEHPFWHHPKITVTPHVAATTRATSAARMLVENIVRVESNLSLLNQVSRQSGY